MVSLSAGPLREAFHSVRVFESDDDERPDHLHALLRRLNLHRDTVLPYTSTDSKEPPMTLDKYLELLDRHHYLEKVGSSANRS
jgi:hypothetical protein